MHSSFFLALAAGQEEGHVRLGQSAQIDEDEATHDQQYQTLDKMLGASSVEDHMGA